MNINQWTHTKTNTTLSNTTQLGSPRAWLNRAVETRQQDLNIETSSLRPEQISVGGVWIRPCVLPPLGNYPALYRFFETGTEPNARGEPQRVIGIAAAVPVNQMLETVKRFRESGAVWTWFNTPSHVALREVLSKHGNPIKRVDHSRAYDLFDQGFSQQEVAERLDANLPNIYHIYKKWKNNYPATPQYQQKIPTPERGAIARMLREGKTVAEVAHSFKVSPITVYKIRDAYGLK